MEAHPRGFDLPPAPPPIANPQPERRRSAIAIRWMEGDPARCGLPLGFAAEKSNYECNMSTGWAPSRAD